MPVDVQRLADEPILIATLTGAVTADDIAQMYVDSALLIYDEDNVVHRITHVTESVTSNFGEMVQALQGSTQELPASVMDPRVRTTFVGTSNWIDFMRNSVKNKGVQVAAFDNMEDALESVRFQLQRG